jgi:hypothetical protein
MKLASTHYDNSETGCCARVDRATWDGQTFVWQGKPFLKDHMRAVLHIPLNFGAVISRDQRLIEDAAAWPEDPFWLTDEVSPWGSDIYTAIDREALPGATVEKLSGTFLTKVFDGPFRDIGTWTRAMDEHVRAQYRVLEKLYFFYATCPKCANKLGENVVVLFARVA